MRVGQGTTIRVKKNTYSVPARLRGEWVEARIGAEAIEVWYAGERDCVPAEECGPHPPFHPLSGTSYIYDLQDGTETQSVITTVADVWPHAA